jgi:hypothetical protein
MTAEPYPTAMLNRPPLTDEPVPLAVLLAVISHGTPAHQDRSGHGPYAGVSMSLGDRLHLVVAQAR